MTTIDTRKLIKVYTMGENKLMALKGIDLTIDKGELVSEPQRQSMYYST